MLIERGKGLGNCWEGGGKEKEGGAVPVANPTKISNIFSSSSLREGESREGEVRKSLWEAGVDLSIY